MECEQLRTVPFLGGTKKVFDWVVVIITATALLITLRTLFFYNSLNEQNVFISQFIVITSFGILLISVGYSLSKNIYKKVLSFHELIYILIFLSVVQLFMLVAWGLIIPLQYALFVIVIVLAYFNQEFRFLKWYTLFNLVLYVMLVFNVIPIYNKGIPEVDIYNRVITSIIFILVNVILFFKSYILDIEKQLNINKSIFNFHHLIFRGFMSFFYMHTLKNSLMPLVNKQYFSEKVISQNTQVISDMINLLNSSKQTINKANVRNLVDVITKIFTTRHKKQIKFKLNFNSFPGKLRIKHDDYQIFIHVLFNLFHNAVKYLLENASTDLDKTIRVDIYLHKSKINLKVFNQIQQDYKISTSHKLFHGLQMSKMLLLFFKKGNLVTRTRNIHNKKYYIAHVLLCLKN